MEKLNRVRTDFKWCLKGNRKGFEVSLMGVLREIVVDFQ